MERNQYKRNWMIKCSRNGFSYVVIVNTSEERLQGYMATELPEAVSYTGATDAEVEAARVLHLPIYLY